jgi:hypothetical protein
VVRSCPKVGLAGTRPRRMTTLLGVEKDIQHVHLSNRSRNLSPHAVDLVVEPLKRESLQSWVWLRQEADQTGGGCEGGHCGGGVLPQSVSCNSSGRVWRLRDEWRWRVLRRVGKVMRRRAEWESDVESWGVEDACRDDDCRRRQCVCSWW